MDPKTLGFLGTALSALIAAASYWAKTRHERRRSTRTVLYYLLEAHHFAHRTHLLFNSFATDYVGHCRRVLSASSVEMPEELLREIRGKVDDGLLAYSTTELQRLSASIAEPLEKALAELAREDPVLAFRLRGREQMMLLSKKIEAAVASPDQASASASSPQVNQKDLDDFIRQVTVRELEAAIRFTAWKCDLLTHLQVRLHLRKVAKESSGEARMMIQSMVDPFLARLAATANTSPAHCNLQDSKS